ncbi:MAG: PilZ domain-containing protein [Deltaproteobacteria bacterium]|nr:PilZ domain-containing protein [Deltaproteobacteria bacterium]
MSFHHMRLSSRLPISLHVDWCVAGNSTHVVSKLDNISAGGAYVSTAMPAPIGTELELSVLTAIGPVPARARVMWADQRGMGVRYASDRDKILG